MNAAAQSMLVALATSCAMLHAACKGYVKDRVCRAMLMFCCVLLDSSTKLYCRLIVERLATPSVRRIFVIDPDMQVVEAIISLSDLAAYLFQ